MGKYEPRMSEPKFDGRRSSIEEMLGEGAAHGPIKAAAGLVGGVD